MILVVDSGSTKADWCIIDNDYSEEYFTTSGANPHFKNSKEIYKEWEKDLLKIKNRNEVKHLFFYGAGCSSGICCKRVEDVLIKFFPKATIKVEHDLTGAARALCGNQRGLVSIHGTGSNCCYYDGHSVKIKSGGIGFILGDEGSGADLGKRIITLYMYDLLPVEISNELEKSYKLSKDMIFENVYRKPYPNRFLAKFAPLIHKFRNDNIISKEVNTSLQNFANNHLLKLRNITGIKEFNSTGSIAWSFKEELEMAALLFKIKLNKVLKAPIEALKDYHKLRNRY